jgi:hypothetical protein
MQQQTPPMAPSSQGIEDMGAAVEAQRAKF